MNFKKFFWPTKEKIIFSAAIFVYFKNKGGKNA